jgi:hypothetical protein
MPSLPFKPAVEGGIFPFDFIFDANAVRALAKLERSEWRRLESRWNNLKLCAAWTPNTLAEVMGTNLRRRNLMYRDLRDLQLAVLRFDELACGEVFPPDDYMVKASIYVLAGREPPIHVDPDPGWPNVIEAFLRLRTPNQVVFLENDGSIVVRMKDDRRTTGVEIVIPRQFAEFARRKSAAMRERRGYTKPVARARLVEDLMEDLPLWLADVSNQLSIPKNVVSAAFQNRDGIFGSSFAFRLITENIYYHHRASGYMSNVKETDAQDIALSTYLPETWGLVTDDGALQRLIRQVLQNEHRVLSFQAFVDLVED